MINFLVRLFRRPEPTPLQATGLWIKEQAAKAHHRLQLAIDQLDACEVNWRADPTESNTQAVEYAWETFRDAQRGVQAVESLMDRHRKLVWRYGR